MPCLQREIPSAVNSPRKGKREAVRGGYAFAAGETLPILILIPLYIPIYILIYISIYIRGFLQNPYGVLTEPVVFLSETTGFFAQKKLDEISSCFYSFQRPSLRNR